MIWTDCYKELVEIIRSKDESVSYTHLTLPTT